MKVAGKQLDIDPGWVFFVQPALCCLQPSVSIDSAATLVWEPPSQLSHMIIIRINNFYCSIMRLRERNMDFVDHLTSLPFRRHQSIKANVFRSSSALHHTTSKSLQTHHICSRDRLLIHSKYPRTNTAAFRAFWGCTPCRAHTRRNSG